MVICPNCRRQLDDAPELSGQHAMCPGCAQAFQMPHYGGTITQPAPAYMVAAPGQRRTMGHERRTNVMLAVLLSFLIPGLGQIAIGRHIAGAVFLVGYLVSLALFFGGFGISGFGFNILFVFMPIIWLWSMLDAAMSS